MSRTATFQYNALPEVDLGKEEPFLAVLEDAYRGIPRAGEPPVDILADNIASSTKTGTGVGRAESCCQDDRILQVTVRQEPQMT